MTRELLLARRDYFNLVHGVTVRAIAAFTDQDLDFRPRPGLRTPRELIFHIYAQEKLTAEAARSGRFTMEAANGSNPEEPSNASAVAALATVQDAVAYANACHQAAEAIFRSMSEADVARPVESPMGTYPAWQYLPVRVRRALAPSRAAVCVSEAAREGAAESVRLLNRVV